MHTLLADSICAAWLLGDGALRRDLADVVRAHATRDRGVAGALRTAAQRHHPGAAASPSPAAEVAAALFAVWQLADQPLRRDVESLIASWARRTPGALQILRRLPDLPSRTVAAPRVDRLPDV